MNPASNLFLIGPMGAGKSTIGRRLAEHFALDFVDLDGEIERRTGATIELIFDLEGETGFRARESALLAEVAGRDGIVLATGGGAVLSASNRALLSRRGFVVYLALDVGQQLTRLARDTRRPLLKTPDRRERLEALAAQRTPLYREIADLEFESAPHGADAAALRLAAEIERHWRRTATPTGTASAC